MTSSTKVTRVFDRLFIAHALVNYLATEHVPQGVVLLNVAITCQSYEALGRPEKIKVTIDAVQTDA